MVYKPTLPKGMVRSHLVLEISRAHKFVTREISSFDDPSGLELGYECDFPGTLNFHRPRSKT